MYSRRLHIRVKSSCNNSLSLSISRASIQNPCIVLLLGATVLVRISVVACLLAPYSLKLSDQQQLWSSIELCLAHVFLQQVVNKLPRDEREYERYHRDAEER